MIRDPKNIIPVGMAVLLHAVIFTSMIIAFDYSRPQPFTPLAVQATLVTEISAAAPPPTVETQPQPEPRVTEEPTPEVENSDQLRREAEEEKRRLDALLEQERLEKIRQQEEEEAQRRAAQEAERRRQEEAERKRQEEADKERRRAEAERRREEEIRRQREENERLRREAEAAARAEEIAAEESRLAAVDAGALALYMAQIRQKIERNWSAPASADAELKCSVRVRQAPGGIVLDVTILACNGDEAVERSVIAAINRSSPLPEPSDPSLFDRNILLNLSIRQ